MSEYTIDSEVAEAVPVAAGDEFDVYQLATLITKKVRWGTVWGSMAKFVTAAKTAGTFAVGDITGGCPSILQNTGATPGAQTVRTAAQMFADIPGAVVGGSYPFRIVNTGAGTLTITADAGPTVTLTGTMTIATNIWRDYLLTFTSATAATIQSVGSGVSP